MHLHILIKQLNVYRHFDIIAHTIGLSRYNPETLSMLNREKVQYPTNNAMTTMVLCT